MTTSTPLDDLVATAAGLADDVCSRAALATVVRALELAAGRPLGDTDDEPLAVLQRRLGRLDLAAVLTPRQASEHLAVLRCTRPGAGRTARPSALRLVPGLAVGS